MKAARSGTVAVVGRPNAGKSTLVNALVGTKVAIVSDKPQTTRRNLLGIRNDDEGQIVFVDTPGLHKPLHRLNKSMVAEAQDALREEDVRLLVIDVTAPAGAGDRFVLELLRAAPAPRIAVLNKIDLVAKKETLLPRLAQLGSTAIFDAIVPVSALTGEGLDVLLSALRSHLAEGDALFPAGLVTTSDDATRIAETIREKFLERTREEIPYGLGVLVEEVRRERGRRPDGREGDDRRGPRRPQGNRPRRGRTDAEGGGHGGPPRPRKIVWWKILPRARRGGAARVARGPEISHHPDELSVDAGRPMP
jgi:GTP-binding protein Era